MANSESKRSDAGAAAAGAGHYRVLARKYRPATLAELIGQEPMVRTLTNAFETGRIAQAYMLTGVRGVGKTTTARIIARALNYSVPGKVDAPSVAMPEMGEHCAAIMQSRHVDVVELDAASHTGVDNMRELIEGARYRPVAARAKVYIIDEVHMLSTPAFNALLKTLEEPPEHVKFIFATTEIRKVPVTVLSRCQRFDLRRIEAGRLAAYLREIVGREQVSAEDEALALIARAAEGSVRDALSILDQAIAHAAGTMTGEEVREMLGLVDRSRVVDLFRAVMAGDVAAALAEFKAQYDAGADPVAALTDLAAFTHLVTRIRYVPEAAEDAGLAEVERREGRAFAEALDLRLLARAWQMLLKGIRETQAAPRPFAAAEMVLVRLAHAAELPTPDELVRMLKEEAAPVASERRPPAGNGERATGSRPPAGHGGGAMPARRATPAPDEAPEPGPGEPVAIASLHDIVALAETSRDLPLKLALEQKVRLVRLEPGRLEISLDADAPAGLVNDLSNRLAEWTGRRWMVAVSSRHSGTTLAEQARAARDARFGEAAGEGAVARLLGAFPGAEIVDVRDYDTEGAGEGPVGDAHGAADDDNEEGMEP